jgi:hypothetical protein
MRASLQKTSPVSYYWIWVCVGICSALTALGDPNKIESKKWVYGPYDKNVIRKLDLRSAHVERSALRATPQISTKDSSIQQHPEIGIQRGGQADPQKTANTNLATTPSPVESPHQQMK